MSNLVQRLLLFFLGLPAIIALVIFLPQARHAAIVAFLIVFAGGSGVELGGLFRAKGISVRPAMFGLIATLIPALCYLSNYLPLAASGRAGLLALGIAIMGLLLFASFSLVGKDGIEGALPAASAYGFALIYPGLFAGFLILIASEPPRAMDALLSFAFMTCSNDSLAWLVGSTLGKRRGIVAVSPNKSIAGFVGGFAGSILGAVVARLIFPLSFAPAPLWAIILMAFAVGAATILGDLFESALKRSARTKDSGSAIPVGLHRVADRRHNDRDDGRENNVGYRAG